MRQLSLPLGNADASPLPPWQGAFLAWKRARARGAIRVADAEPQHDHVCGDCAQPMTYCARKRWYRCIPCEAKG